MSLYIQLRDELLSSEEELTVRQYWIKADCIELQADCLLYLDTKSGEWEHIIQKDNKFYLSPSMFEDKPYPDDLGYDFLWIRDRLMDGCKLD